MAFHRSRRRPQIIEQSMLRVGDIDVLVSRKRVKNLSMRVKSPDGRVEITAPYRISDDDLAAFVSERASWIQETAARVRTSTMAQAEGASKAEIERWRALVKQQTPPLVRKWEGVLGVTVGELAYRNMKSRWGSCQPATGRVCINIRLALFPPECLDYVVLHELCHLLVRGHGPAFKALLDAHMPDWRERRAMLR